MNILKNLESSVVSIIRERLDKISKIKADDLSELIKLQNINSDLQNIKENITDMIDKARTEVYNIVESSASEYYKEASEKHGGRLLLFEENQEILRFAEKATQEILKKLSETLKSNTIGFTNSDGEFRFLEQGYREAVNSAVTQVMKNQEDIEDRIESSIESLAENGLTKLIIPQSGVVGDYYQRNIDSVLQAELRYALTQMLYAMAEMLAEEIGATGYEISYHMGHRPTHIHGGKQYTFEQMKTLGVDDMLEDYNCRHWKFPVIVGVTPPKYSMEELSGIL